MPKRKAATAVVNNTEESGSDSPAKKEKSETKKSVRGRGRPPLSAEEKAKREAKKTVIKSPRGRGRPKGSITRPWLSYSPWIRKPLAFANSQSVLETSPLLNEQQQDGERKCDESYSSDASSLSDTLISKSDRDSDKIDDQNEEVSPSMDSAPKTANSPTQSPVSSKDIANVTDKVNSRHKRKTHRSSRIRPSLPMVELEVLHLQKNKLTIEIEVLHLKKRKLLLQLEQMAHSSTPFVP